MWWGDVIFPIIETPDTVCFPAGYDAVCLIRPEPEHIMTFSKEDWLRGERNDDAEKPSS